MLISGSQRKTCVALIKVNPDDCAFPCNKKHSTYIFCQRECSDDYYVIHEKHTAGSFLNFSMPLGESTLLLMIPKRENAL